MQREEKHICRVFSHTNTDVQITHTQKITLRSQQDKPEMQRKRSNSQGRKPKGPRNTRQDGIREPQMKTRNYHFTPMDSAGGRKLKMSKEESARCSWSCKVKPPSWRSAGCVSPAELKMGRSWDPTLPWEDQNSSITWGRGGDHLFIGHAEF